MTGWDAPGAGSPVLLQQVAGPAPEHSSSTALLLHGMGDSPAIWRSTTQHLADSPMGLQLSVWTAALPWRTGAAPEWTHRTDPSDWMADALGAMCEHTGGAQIIVAHSYAATAVLDLLTGLSERGRDGAARWGIRALVLVAPFYRARPEDFDWELTTSLAGAFVDTVQEGIRVGGGHRGAEWVQRAMATRVCEMIGPYGWLRFVDLYLRTPWLRLDLLEIPVVVVCGSADRIAAASEGAALARRLGNAELAVFEGCGHFPMAEHPDRFVALLDKLLKTITHVDSTAAVSLSRRRTSSSSTASNRR